MRLSKLKINGLIECVYSKLKMSLTHVITLEGGCILFLLAIVGLTKRLFLFPIKSLKDGLLSGSVCGFCTSLRNACLENLCT